VKRQNGRDWFGVFDDRNKLIGITERFPDGWHVFIAGRDVGVVVSPTAAKWLIDRINNSDAENQWMCWAVVTACGSRYSILRGRCRFGASIFFIGLNWQADAVVAPVWLLVLARWGNDAVEKLHLLRSLVPDEMDLRKELLGRLPSEHGQRPPPRRIAPA
jgi:hypothetical protein